MPKTGGSVLTAEQEKELLKPIDQKIGKAGTKGNTSNQSHDDSDRNWNTSKVKRDTKDLTSIDALVHDDG